MCHGGSPFVAKGYIATVIVEQMNPGHLTDLFAIEIPGQGTLHVAAWIAIHDKRKVINFTDIDRGLDRTFALATHLVQLATPSSLGPVPCHHVKVRLRCIIGTGQVDANASDMGPLLIYYLVLTNSRQLLRLKPKFPCPLLPRSPRYVDIRVVLNPQGLIL